MSVTTTSLDGSGGRQQTQTHCEGDWLHEADEMNREIDYEDKVIICIHPSVIYFPCSETQKPSYWNLECIIIGLL